LAAQVAVTTSLADPVSDFEINVKATLALLEALRARPEPAPLIFASTNKVYGDLADIGLEITQDAYLPVDPAVRANGIGESRPLDFHTPYGCSKGRADQYVLDYARSFDVPTSVIRMSCIYGQRQMGTEDQGWVAHFAIRAIEGSRSRSTATARRCATCSTSPTRSRRMWRRSRHPGDLGPGVQPRRRAGERDQPAPPHCASVGRHRPGGEATYSDWRPATSATSWRIPVRSGARLG
jgi:hypothetical protein